MTEPDMLEAMRAGDWSAMAMNRQVFRDWIARRAQMLHDIKTNLFEGYAPQSSETPPTAHEDPDGPPVPLPTKEAPTCVLAHPAHDFIGAMWRGWRPVA